MACPLFCRNKHSHETHITRYLPVSTHNQHNQKIQKHQHHDPPHTHQLPAALILWVSAIPVISRAINLNLCNTTLTLILQEADQPALGLKVSLLTEYFIFFMAIALKWPTLNTTAICWYFFADVPQELIMFWHDFVQGGGAPLLPCLRGTLDRFQVDASVALVIIVNT